MSRTDSSASPCSAGLYETNARLKKFIEVTDLKRDRRSTGTSMQMVRLRSRWVISSRRAAMSTALTSDVMLTPQLRERASTSLTERCSSMNVGSPSSWAPGRRHARGVRTIPFLSRSKYLSKLFSAFSRSDPS